MAELIFGIGQTRKKKESAAKVRRTISGLKRVTINETVEMIIRSDQHDRDQKYNATKRETKKNLKHVTQEETGEMAVRKEQFNREKLWKQTGRNQVKKNSKFDMARSLFGGAVGGSTPTLVQVPTVSLHEEEFSEMEYSEEMHSEEETTMCGSEYARSEEFAYFSDGDIEDIDAEEITCCSKGYVGEGWSLKNVEIEEY